MSQNQPFKEFDGDGPDTQKMKSVFVPSKKIQAAGIGAVMLVVLFICDALGLF